MGFRYAKITFKYCDAYICHDLQRQFQLFVESIDENFSRPSELYMFIRRLTAKISDSFLNIWILARLSYQNAVIRLVGDT